MKNILAPFFLLISLNFFANNSYNIKLISQDNNSVLVEYQLNNYSLIDSKTINSIQHKKLVVEGGRPILNLGEPELLKFTSNIQLPETGVSNFTIVDSKYSVIESVSIIPSKGNLYRNIDPSLIPFNKGPLYEIDQDYPSSIFSLSEPYIQRDLRGQTLNFVPFQYNPVQKTLKVYNKIVVKIEFNQSVKGNNELVRINDENILNELISSYQRRYLNYIPTRYNSIGQEGSMLIISPSEYFNELAPFIEWKRQSGREVVLVDIADIGNNQSSIYNYVRTYYQQNTDFLYLLLVGDHNKVAAYDAGSTGGWMSETKWSDAKYGLVSNSNDWYPDIYVGRFSPSNLTDLNNIVQRNLEYETNPDTSDYYLNAIGLGSNEGAGYGDDGEADWQHLRNIRTDLLNYGYQNVFEFYDGSHGGEDANGNPNSTIISNAVNGGISLFNYTGHGDINTCSSGNYSSSHINSATNNGKYPFVVSVACNNGTFTSGTCISEAWQRASSSGSPTGAIAAAGSSILMSWAPPMASQDEIVDILVESYPNNKMHSIGALFYSGQMKMLDDYPNPGKEVVETWVLFGDPATLFRSDIPSDFVVEHSETEEIGLTSTTILCDVENAAVTLWNGDSLIGKSNVLNGQVDFNFDSINTIDTLSIIINAYNKTPYFGQLRTTNPPVDPLGNSEDLLFGPNPINSNHQVNLIFELLGDQETYFEIFNPLGQLIYSKSMLLNAGFYGPNYIQLVLDLSEINLSSGIYSLSTNINNSKTVKQLLVP